MENEIKEIIEKNLPAQVGDILKKRLEQADKDAIKVDQLEKSLGKSELANQRLQEELLKYRQFDDRNARLEQREDELADRERSLEIKRLEFELAAEKEKVQFAKDVALGLVRNTEYRHEVFKNTNVPVMGANGCTYNQAGGENGTETKKAE